MTPAPKWLGNGGVLEDPQEVLADPELLAGKAPAEVERQIGGHPVGGSRPCGEALDEMTAGCYASTALLAPQPAA